MPLMMGLITAFFLNIPCIPSQTLLRRPTRFSNLLPQAGWSESVPPQTLPAAVVSAGHTGPNAITSAVRSLAPATPRPKLAC